MSKFLYILLLSSLNILALNIYAQKPLRYEIDADEFKNVVYVSLEENGLIALKEKNTSSFESAWEIERLTVDFKSLWKKNINIDRDKTPYKHHLRNDSILHLIFSDNYLKGGLEHFVINYKSGDINKYNYNYDSKVRLNSIEIIENKVFAAAYKKPKTIKQIGQFFYSLTLIPAITGSKINKTQPKVYIASKKDEFLKVIDFKFENDAFILSSNVDTSRNVFCLVINESSRKVNNLLYYEINLDGEIITKAELNNLEINFLSSYLVFSENNEIFFMGSYDYSHSPNKNESEQPLGIFFSKIHNSEFTIFKTHKFSAFENAIKILSEKGLINFKSSKEDTKQINIRLNWVPHKKVEIIDNKYVISGEIYYVDYRPEYQRTGAYDPYGYYRSYSYWQETFDGYVFTDAIIAAINTDGDLVWDNHMFIENIKTYYLEPNTLLYDEDGASLIMYYYDDNIHMKIFKGNETVSKESKTSIKTYSDSEVILQESNTKMLHWYDSYFLISGYQKLKNSYNEKRKVYFLNKIAFQ